MDLYRKVRLACAEGMSARSAAQHFGISRDSVRKMLSFSVPPGYSRTAAVKRPKLDGFTAFIEQWLREDQERNRKQRHTAKRVFERLRDEHGFSGGYAIIKDFMREQERRGREMFVPLTHPPGHAQADFGEAMVAIGGVEQKAHFFALDMAHSDACYVRAYQAAMAEAWVDGHVQAFAFFGCVPTSILYDNDKCLVARIQPDGTRIRAKLFSGFLSHYLSGLFAAAVTPVALAAVTDISATKAELGRRLTFVSLAGISGFLLGPTLSVALTRGMGGTAGDLGVSLVATGGLALIAAVAVALTVRPAPAVPFANPQVAVATAPKVVRWLLALGFVVSAGVTVFEVGLALRGRQEPGLTPGQIAAMFTLCSGVMIVVQAVVFSPLVKPELTRWLIAPAFAVMGVGLFAVPLATDFRAMLGVVGAVAASAGVLSPILTYWIASHAGHKSGADLGKQTAVASLGAAVGSAAGGLLYDVTCRRMPRLF